MKIVCLIWVLVFPFVSFAKVDKEKIDQSPIGKLKRDIEYITSDLTEGRMTGSKGELVAAEYIENRFKSMSINPYKSKYKWEFTTKTGMCVSSSAYFKLFDQNLKIGNEVIVMPYGSGSSLSGFSLPKVYEQDNVWLISMKDIKVLEQNNPQKYLHEQARSFIQRGASSVLFFNDIDPSQDLTQLNLQPFETLDKPVCVLNHKAYEYYIKGNLKKDWIIVDAKLGFEESNSTGKNIVGHIDNKAPFTIVISAHYDHLGNFGENYKGADDNASGVAALLSLAEMIKLAGLKNYNYVFIAFSGSQQGMQGSKNFLQQNEFFAPTIAALIDLNMLGRYNNITKNIFVSGVGTSPIWSGILQTSNKGLTLKIDSSGYGYSDYTNFYNKNIPVLQFSTGYHDDYLKVSDDATKINYAGEYDIINYMYRVIAETDRRTKPIFNKTNDIVPELEKLKTDLGIIPNFTFNDNGIQIGACIPNKLASKSGMLSGDVITKIGPFKIIDFDDYMQAIRKSEPGKEVTFIVQRGKNEFKFFVVM